MHQRCFERHRRRGFTVELYQRGNLLVAGRASGLLHAMPHHLLRMALPAASITQSHVIAASLNLTSPPPYEARINGGGRPYLDQGGAMWVEDRAYHAGSFGINGGTSNMIANAIAGTADDVLYQSEHLGNTFSAFFDCPNGTYETVLYETETQGRTTGQRLFNVSMQGQQVLSNFDIFAASGGANTALCLTFTNTVSSGQLEIDFHGIVTAAESNACVSAIRVRKIADPVFESVPPTIMINSPANGATVAGTLPVFGTASDNVAVAKARSTSIVRRLEHCDRA